MNDQELAEFLAKQTGKVIAQVAAEKKNELSPTELGAAGDLAGHEFLVHALSEYRPLDHLLSEEGEDTAGRLSANRVWIVDPLDGTSHYSNLEPDYAVHIALWERNSPAPFELPASSISVPAMNLVIGMRKTKLPEIANGPIRILISATRPPAELDQICEILKNQFPDRMQPELISMGSVGAKLAQIIAGKADLYVNTGGFYEWDVAAPAAVAKAHGFAVCDMSGNELTFNNQDVFVPNTIIGRPEFVNAITKFLA